MTKLPKSGHDTSSKNAVEARMIRCGKGAGGELNAQLEFILLANRILTQPQACSTKLKIVERMSLTA